MYLLLAILGLFGLAAGLLLIVFGLIKRKKTKGGMVAIISAIMIIVAFIITPTPETEQAAPVEEVEEVEEEPATQATASEVVETQEAGAATLDDWNAFIDGLVANGESENDKFYALEVYAKDYVTNVDEFNEFQKTIINDYTAGTYLNNYTDHKTMLTKIFKAIVVEKTASGPVKDFAFDFYQNTKYVYRGVDAIDSDAVQSNERQMNKALEKMK